MKKILVTGAVGQIGSELSMSLRERYGNDNVVAGGRKTKPSEKLLNSGPFEIVDCVDAQEIANVVKKHDIDTIYHLAAILSAVAEANPVLAWNVNINGLYNILEVARDLKCAVFTPSSIGAFGPTTPLDNTPQDTIQRPNTMYGVTKVAGELLCDYYFKRFGVDTRGVRYPGIISNETLPGGGTTDYAVEIYYEAIKHKKYTCNLPAGTFLDMMYMPDAIKGTIQLMEAPQEKVKNRFSYNFSAISFSAKELAESVAKLMPGFKCDYSPDSRQKIANSWPKTIDDSSAREDWGWKHEYTLDRMSEDMLKNLKQILEKK